MASLRVHQTMPHMNDITIVPPAGEPEPVSTTTTTIKEEPPAFDGPRASSNVVDAPRTDWPVSLQPCGGDLPPCSVAWAESRGDYGAVNPTGCGGQGCFGKWQFSGSWAGKLGLPLDLRTATPEQQDNAARLLWAGGAGCSHWGAC